MNASAYLGSSFALPRHGWRAALLSVALMLSASAQATAMPGPTVSASLPEDGARGIALDTPIEVQLGSPLSADEAKQLQAMLVGPSGFVKVNLTVNGRSVKVQPTGQLLPDCAYTLVLSLKPAAEGKKPAAVAGSAKTLAVVGWRTRALAGTQARLSGASTSAAGPADEVFHPAPDQRNGNWTTGNRYPFSRDLRVVAEEQQDVLNRLPAPARERLQARMQELGEYVPPEILAPRATVKIGKAMAANQAAVIGQVLRLNGKPLSHVRLSIGEHSTQTDARGEFSLMGVPAGEQVMVIDARQAQRSQPPAATAASQGTSDELATYQVERQPADFGRYQYRVNLVKGYNELPHTIWLTRIDHEHATVIDAPTKRETVVTHPDIPGLELRIPAGAVIRDADGRIVNEVSITPIPIDQVPFPMPYTDVGVYYTIQPGGARIESVDGKPVAATLHYPNYSSQQPGAKRQLFDYDAQQRGWYVYAEGVVSADGKRIESKEPFKIYQLSLSSAASPGGGPGSGGPGCSGSGAPAPAPAPGGDQDGDPVLCSSGLFVESAVDLDVRDVTPIRVSRIYRTSDGTQRAFGVGSAGFYNQYLYFENLASSMADAIQLVGADGVAVRFTPVNWNNINYMTNGATYESNEPGPYMKARITLSGSHGDFILSTKSGERYGFSYYNSRLKWQEDRFGNRTNVMRDGSSRVSRIVSPNGRWVEFKYTSAYCSECITQAVDHTGRSVTYAYDNLGQLKTVTAPESVLTDYAWNDSTHQILTVKDARRNIKVTNEYYSGTGNAALDGRVKKQTYADGTFKSFAYEFDTNNKIKAAEVTDQRGIIRRREYDASRYVVKDMFAKGTAKEAVWQFQRDPTTHLVTLQTDPLGRQTQYQYDASGNEKQRTVMYGTAQATTWQTTYEPQYNQPLVSTDPLGRKTTRVYDANGVLQETRDDLGHKTTYAWYPSGQLQSVSQWPGIPTASTQLTTTFTYEYGDLVKVTDPKSRSTQFNVDALGRVIGVRDAANQLSTMTYDGQDRVTQRCDASGACANLVFDGNGNLTQFKLGTTQRDMTYDAMNRLQTEGRNTGQTPAVETSVAYTNTDGKQTITQASGRVTETTYDALWRRDTVKISQGGTLKRTQTYTFDAGNRLTGLADTASGSLSYTFDDRFDAIKTETGPTGTMTYAYYANGLRQSATPSSGTAISYGFDAANRLQTLTQAAGSGNAQPASALTVGFAYDDANRRSRLTLANGITLDYGWDEASQLTSLTYKLANGTTLGDLAYGYDSLGRRTSVSGAFARTNLPPTEALPVGTDGRTTTDNGTTLQYDSNGRLTQDASYKYNWNELGQLIEIRNVSDNALRASYTYDAIGRRVSKMLDGSTTQYLHDGANPIQLQDGSGVAKENLLVGGLDEWFARTVAGQTQTYLSDALGSIVRLTDPSGVKLVDYTYDPYGGTTNDNASNTNVFQYAGRENDGLGLYFNRARYYKPKWGKFISQDPIGLEGGDNSYQYAGGGPVGYRDALGLQTEAGLPVCFFGGPANPVCDAVVIVNGCKWLLIVAGVIVAAHDTGKCSGGACSSANPPTDGASAPVPTGNDGQRPSKTPNTGPPGSTTVNPGSGQTRTYGPDGRPATDIDYDHDHGQGVPHQHDWNDGKRGPGVPVKK